MTPARAAAPLLCLALLAAGLLPAPAAAQRRMPLATRVIDGDTLHQVLAPDAIPAIDDPERVPLAEARERALPDELFLAVIVRGEARAYSTWLLERHEIVNDTVGGVPIAASW